jgi:DNA-binding NarL/FixJ family response regulator
MSIRIVIVDDHWVVREGIRSVLRSGGGFEIVGEASTSSSGIELINTTKPDIVLVDIRLPDVSGAKICQWIYEEGLPTKVVVITALLDWNLVQTCLHWGARGYLLKGSGKLNLRDSLQSVMAGEIVLDPKVVNILAAYIRQQPDKESDSILTPKEMEILRLMSRGLSNREIGERIYLSQARVKDYVHSILKKLNTNSRVEAILIAAKSGLL